jgi:hypothetical protein
MQFINGDHSFEMNDKNTYFFYYDNDLLDGIYHDIDDQNFAFISKYSSAHYRIQDELAEEGAKSLDFGTPDYNQIPHCWIIAALGRYIAEQAESEANGIM